jgi:hypothetical protein
MIKPSAPAAAALLLLGLALPAFAQSEKSEKFVGTQADIRTVLHFKVSDAAIKKLLPAGWEVDSPASGPYNGVNFRMTFIDRLLSRDPEGKPSTPLRYVVWAIPAKKTGAEAQGTMIGGGFASHPSGAPGAYGSYVKAEANVERKIRTDAAEISSVEESWEFRAGDGDEIEFQIQYLRGMPTQSKAEVNVYSAIKPDFYRIYRLEQAVDVLRGAGAPDRVQKISFKASGATLGPIFDGSEQLISVTSIPWYTRSTYLPGSLGLSKGIRRARAGIPASEHEHALHVMLGFGRERQPHQKQGYGHRP